MIYRKHHSDFLSNDAHLIFDPHDSMSTQAWDKRSTEDQRKCLKLFHKIAKRVNVQWQISINVRGSRERVLYPLLFSSYADAHDWIALSPDPALRPPGYRSWSVEAVRSPVPKIHEPKVRKTP